MNHNEIFSRLRLYIKQVDDSTCKNYKLLIVINLITFLNKKKWITRTRRGRLLKKVIICKINEFNEVINKYEGEYHPNLIRIFQETSNIFLEKLLISMKGSVVLI